MRRRAPGEAWPSSWLKRMILIAPFGFPIVAWIVLVAAQIPADGPEMIGILVLLAFFCFVQALSMTIARVATHLGRLMQQPIERLAAGLTHRAPRIVEKMPLSKRGWGLVTSNLLAGAVC